MKLIVQIPCFDEEQTLPAVIRDIPRQVPGIDQVEILVIDDGSNDLTSEVARECGADHVIRFPHNRGLGQAFKAGLTLVCGWGPTLSSTPTATTSTTAAISAS